jgi:hypothetical protein
MRIGIDTCEPIQSYRHDVRRLHAARPVDRALMDGSRWDPTDGARKSAGGYPVTLRRYWPRLCENVFHNRTTKQNMRDYEELSLYKFRVKLPTGECKFAGAQFFLDHLGLHTTPLVRILELYPCLGWCDRWGNKIQNQASTEAFPCGPKIFCQPCREVMHLTGGCWHRQSLTDVSYTVLSMALNHWTNVQVVQWKTYSEPAHDCGPQCPKNARNQEPSSEW